MKEYWIRDQELNFGETKGAKLIAFETSDIEGHGIIHVIEYSEYEKLQKQVAGLVEALQEGLDIVNEYASGFDCWIEATKVCLAAYRKDQVKE